MKKLLVGALVCMSVVFAGCTTAERGRLAGDALWTAYVKIKQDRGPEVAAKIQRIWMVIDNVQTFEELPAAYQTITADIDTLIDEKISSNKIASFVKKIRKQIDDKIADAIDDKLDSEKAQEFLIALRNEVRECIARSAGTTTYETVDGDTVEITPEE